MNEADNRDNLALINAYLDDALDEAQRADFEKRLTGDALLAASFDLQQKIDDAIVRSFAHAGSETAADRILAAVLPADIHVSGPTSMRLSGSAVSADPSPNPWRIVQVARRPLAIAAMVTLLIGVPVLVLEWKSFTARGRYDNAFADLRSMPLDELYQKQVDASFEPQWRCEPEAFANYFRDRLGQSLTFTRVPEHATKWGVSYVGGLTARSISVLAVIDGQSILVCCDRVETDKAPAFPENCPLHVHRRVIGDLVLYEISPLSTSKLLDLFYEPNPPARPR